MSATSTGAGAVLLSVSLGLVITAAAQQPSPTFAITHITVIDATGAPAKPDMTVVISGNRIATIRAARNVVVPTGAKVVDGKCRYLIPGLWDMNVHLFSKEMAWPAGPGISNKDWFFPLFVANGVTASRDMHTDPGEIKLAAEWNQQRVAGRMIGPAVAVSSRMVDGVRPTPGALEVTTAAEARQEVRPERHMGRAHRLGRARSICERRREPE